MEFMYLYILALLIVILGLCFSVLFISLGIKGIGYIMGLWLGMPEYEDDNDEEKG